MIGNRNLLRIPRLALAAALSAALAASACSDEPVSADRTNSDDASVVVRVSSRTAALGERVAVGVELDVAPGAAGGLLGALQFDASRLRYVGQSDAGEAITVVNAKRAESGEIRFTSFHPQGVSGRVAHFVFETKGAGYADGLRYHHQVAATTAADLRELRVRVSSTVTEDRTLGVPADARNLSLADWSARLGAGADRAPIALRPGEYRLNLAYGDVDFDGSVGLFDYLAVANAAVGNDQIISNTDGPAVDADLVIAGNVFPANGSLACGTEADGSRVLDLFDYLAISGEVAGGQDDDCVGAVIPGRAALPGTRQSITASSSPDLIIGSGETVTLTKDRVWQLEGILRVQDGGRLNIEAGTRIEGLTNAGETQAIFVERGGLIFSEGTQNEPIVMTCTESTKVKGCWGGVFVAGRGTVNLGDALLGGSPDGGCAQRPGEGNAPIYGGCNPNDNSGVIRYTVIEYGGRVVNANNELNGLTLGGVGRGTTVEYVQIHGGTDDGIEFFGGEVNTRYLVLTGNDDDGFDVSFGYNGHNQFVILQNDFGSAAGDSKAIEADGNEPAPGQILPVRTAPQLYNFTMIGHLSQVTPVGGTNNAIHLRRGVGLTLANSLVAGYGNGLDIDDPLTCDAWGTGPVRILATTFIDVANLGNDDASDPACVVGGSTTEGEEAFVLATASNSVRTGLAAVLRDATHTNLPDWRMLLVGGVPAEGNTVAPPAGSTFIVATNHRGAVPAGSAGQIPWYSGWTRPFQSAVTP